ncbi:hypothetical protein LCL96_17025 [Rossellomorea aquimaris]|uniref:hypothetical protein n=1 Tax=Rossellomorea aquimaris TaxID=189382 RepID=UPI001CD4DB2B|nr:hypothetical protein [Rossellomorea aquimaris]MCA1060641.1 hypothetical protein [Rossellomorea aquimaris]
MTLMLLLGMIGLFFFVKRSSENTYSIKWITSLDKYEWFQNPWLIGVFLFVINLILFGTTALVLYGITYLMIPYIHLVIMVAATVTSILVWQSLVYAREWMKGERWKAGMTGSSFYLLLFLYILYEWNTYVPIYPGEDEFMSSLGFFIGELVTGMAFLICFVMVVFLPVHKRL